MWKRDGFSLIELLIVVAIIGILMSMYMGTLSKARRKAEQVATMAALRDRGLGRMADHANIARPVYEGASREECRAAYRQVVPTGKADAFITEPRFRVRNEEEFRAYWHTLINPDASGELEFADGGALVARDEAGNTFYLPPIDAVADRRTTDNYPLAWEFLSKNLADTTMNGLGINVLHSDGNMEYVKYPGPFPACRAVAELSDRFVRATE